MTELLKRCPKTSHPIAQDCFKLLGALLRQVRRPPARELLSPPRLPDPLPA